MENKITEEEISAFVIVESEARANTSISYYLRSLSRFGKDIKEITSNIKEILYSEPTLRESYLEMRAEQEKVIDLLTKYSDSITSGKNYHSKRHRDLQRELRIETVHLGNFCEKLEGYLMQKAIAQVDGGRKLDEFRQDSECEDYMNSSPLCQEIYSIRLQLAERTGEFRR